MAFEDEFRDEATADASAPYKPLDFTTDALRHSKVKLTWDDDDPERLRVTRRVLTRKEIEENDFRAYLASSSDSDGEDEGPKSKGKADRVKMRALLLGGGDDTLPEGWSRGGEDEADDVDMEITFMPGLSEARNGEEETTIEKYARKMREKKKKRKEEHGAREPEKSKGVEDDFFGEDSSDGGEEGEEETKKGRKGKKDRKAKKDEEAPAAHDKQLKSTAEELALVAISDNPAAEPRHFDMKAVLKAEKSKGKKRRGKKRGVGEDGEQEQELQADFAIDVRDERFAALHEDHTFAIDPSNPQ